jgi:hypothetical protein
MVPGVWLAVGERCWGLRRGEDLGLGLAAACDAAVEAGSDGLVGRGPGQGRLSAERADGADEGTDEPRQGDDADEVVLATLLPPAPLGWPWRWVEAERACAADTADEADVVMVDDPDDDGVGCVLS